MHLLGQPNTFLAQQVPFLASLGEWACILTCAKLKHMRVPMSAIDPEVTFLCLMSSLFLFKWRVV